MRPLRGLVIAAMAAIVLALGACGDGSREGEGPPEPPSVGEGTPDGQTTRDGTRDGDDGRDGTTVERPPEPPPPVPAGNHTPSTAVGPGCRVSVHFTIEAGGTRSFADLAPGIKVDSAAVLSVRITPELDGIGRYPGTLTLSVSRDAAAVPFTTGAGAPFQTSDPFVSIITFGELEKDPLSSELDRVERELRNGRASYYLRAPANVTRANPVRQTLVGTATWKPKDLDPCTVSEDLTITWTAGQSTITRPPDDQLGKNHLRGSLQPGSFTDPDGNELVVAPVYHYWEVTDPYDCCGGPGPYQVIQLARVVYEDDGNNPPFRKGHDWSLDIREAEKRRARADQSYDPTFTNDPRGTNPGGSMVSPAPGGRSSIRQEDAPGMTRQRYQELVAAAKQVKVTWQFLSFLVCPPDIGQNDDPAAKYLSDALVCRVALWEMTWTFPEGVGAQPVVDVHFEEVHPTGRREPCTANLDEWIDANGLRAAYEDPPEARSNDLTPAAHDALRSDVARMKIAQP